MLDMTPKTVWRFYLSLSLQTIALRRTVQELLELLRERPGFADEFDQIALRVLQRNKNETLPPGVAIEDEAYAATHNVQNIEQLFEKWCRHLREGEPPA